MQKQRQFTKVKKFIDPEKMLRAIPLHQGMVVADFGCGNGYYSVAAGALVGSRGQVYAVDVSEDGLSQTATLAKLLGLNNVSTRQCDLEKFGTCQVEELSCDLVIMSSLLHLVADRESPIKEAYRVLVTGGKILVVDWQPEAVFGPSPEERIAKTEVQSLLERSGFRPVQELDAGSFHYALLYEK